MGSENREIRLLGARDAAVGALIAVRAEIGYFTHYNHIPPRHTKRLARREEILAPLRRLEERMVKEVERIKKALDETRPSP